MMPSVCAMLRGELVDGAEFACDAYANDTYADLPDQAGPKSPLGAILIDGRVPENSSHVIISPALQVCPAPQLPQQQEVVAATDCVQPALVIESDVAEEVVTAVIVADDPVAATNNLLLPIQGALPLGSEPIADVDHEPGLSRVNPVYHTQHPSSRTKTFKILKKKKKKTVPKLMA